MLISLFREQSRGGAPHPQGGEYPGLDAPEVMYVAAMLLESPGHEVMRTRKGADIGRVIRCHERDLRSPTFFNHIPYRAFRINAMII